jgi:hypothetical protein
MRRIALVTGMSLAIALAACGGSASSAPGSASPAPKPTPTAEPEYDYPDSDDVGTCFNPINDRDDGGLLAMRVVDCDEPHLRELIGTPELDAGPNAEWPGQAAVDRESEDLCLAVFEDYVGVPFEESRLDASYISTTEAYWLGGDRLVICVVETSSAAPFNSSIRGLEE